MGANTKPSLLLCKGSGLSVNAGSPQSQTPWPGMVGRCKERRQRSLS